MNATIDLDNLTDEYLSTLSNEELRVILENVSAEMSKALDNKDRATNHYFWAIHHQIRQHITKD